MSASPPLILLLLLLLSISTTATSATTNRAPPPTPSPTISPIPTVSHSPLDPKQVRALQSLGIPTVRDPCIPASTHNATVCDFSSPFRHLLQLHLLNCSSDLSLSNTALAPLSTLQSVSFTNCPSLSATKFPPELTYSLHSFSSIHSFRHVSGVWLSRLVNLTELTVMDTSVNATRFYVIFSHMQNLKSVTISNANINGYIPKSLPPTLSHIDFSGNELKGGIPISLTMLEKLEFLNLSSSSLSGEIPDGFGDLISLKNVSLSSNSLSGSIPDSVSAIQGLIHLDLSSNRLNGTVPVFLSKMKQLRYLNLQNNEFHGVLPFNATFLQRLVVLKVSGNSNLCYNHSILSSKLKLGIAMCDKHGLPILPPPSADDSAGDTANDYDNDNSEDSGKQEKHHGPNKVVLGVAIALSSIVFLIIFLILLSKCCR